MTFSPYSVFTVILLVSLFITVFAAVASCVDVVRCIPLAAVYVFLAVMGLRLLIPIEINKLSVEINSYSVMTRINDFMGSEIFTVGSVSFNMGSLLIFVWIIGIIVRSVYFLAGYCSFRRTINQLVRVRDEHILDTVDLICSELGIKSKPRVFRIRSNCSPSEYGLFKQTIVLNSAEYTDEEMYYILLHEITHHKLKNDAAKLFAKILELVFWWNPVVYLLYNQIDRLMEIYTDLFVTKGFTKTQRYAYLSCLYNVYRGINTASVLSSAFVSPVIGRARESEIKKRFETVAKGRKADIPMCIFAAAAALLCYASTFFVVIQPYYPIPEGAEAPIEIDKQNSYIAEENGKYVLYYNGEALIVSSNKEDLELILKNRKK